MLTFLDALKRILVGRPFRTERLKQAPLRRRLALPLLSSNALSSVAYAPDEVLMTLAIAGLSAIYFSPVVGIAIMAVMLVIIASYRQSVKAYPSGRGDYEIASVNLGPRAGTTVAAALLVDFVLTVAVSMSSAVHYVVAAFPALNGHQTQLACAGVVLLALLNLRGLGRSRLGKALPTYLFIAAMLVMIATGAIAAARGSLGAAPSAGFEILPEAGYDSSLTGLLGVVLVLRAFSTGSAALTGIEAPISNVQNLARPRARNAASILLMLGVIATVLTLAPCSGPRREGAHGGGPAGQPARRRGPGSGGLHPEPRVGQLAQAVFGAGSFGFFVILAATVAVLWMAGHTAFTSFPTWPRIWPPTATCPPAAQTRDRLGFSNGIIALGVGALVLVLIFNAHVATLIQLYVVGVFVSFTLSQLGMVRHWSRQLASTAKARVRHRIMRSRLLNLVGFVLTAAVLVIVLVTKFIFGAWLAVLAIVVLYLVMYSIHAHYAAVDRELSIDTAGTARRCPRACTP
ncbi:APC family permease [Arthrobacter sp.]|uniref:APC family permease n=1 Tax=Arthrobacter sp. TaxID=1667 RepID=UPI003A8DE106